MPTLKVIVKRLNRRKSPVLDFDDKSNVVDVVSKGYAFESTGEITNRLGTWYKDRDGYYYWEAGLELLASKTTPNFLADETTQQLTHPFDAVTMSWGHQFCNIPFIWSDLDTMGGNVTVAIIDTGIDVEHSDLKKNIHSLSKSFVGGSIADVHGHGTNMAGIVAADGTSKVFGVAPAAKILVVKAAEQKNDVDLETFAEAINFASSIPEVDIISISYSVVTDHPSFKQAVLNACKANKMVLGAIGNARDITNPDGPDDDTFPACYNPELPDQTGVLGIGAFNEAGNLSEFSNWSKHLKCLAPGESILTTHIGNETKEDNGTSIATAFTAGCLALMISFCKSKNLDIQRCVPAILSTCDDIGITIGPDIRTGYGRINLRNAISKIKEMT